jgi:hypothetical protein
MHPAVLNWSSVIDDEIAAKGYPFPPELIYSIIDLESNGYPTAKNPKTAAAGLMQVMPVTLADYNKQHKPPISYPQMISADHGAEQIRVGLWILAAYWRRAYRYLQPKLETVPLDQLVRIADAYYAAGPGRVEPMLDRLEVPTFEAFETVYLNSPITTHARRVWKVTSDQNPLWNLAEIEAYVSKGHKPTVPTVPTQARTNPLVGYAVAAIVIAFVFRFFFAESKKSGLQQTH